jgi:hypothetical protein
MRFYLLVAQVSAIYPGGAGKAVRHQAEPGDEEGARRREAGGKRGGWTGSF